MRREEEGNNLPPPHTDEDFIPSPESDAPIAYTKEEQRILADLIGGSGARPGPDQRSRRARSAVERAMDRAAEGAWERAILAAATAGNFDEATRIAKLGVKAFRGDSPSDPDLPSAA